MANATDRVAIVYAEFNSDIVQKLLTGALNTLTQSGMASSEVTTFQVPGAFELPLMAKKLAQTSRYSAVICLGAVIKGDTDHYEYVCQAATLGILQAGLETGVPIIFGVLTCATEGQALERAGGAHGNKGADAAMAALEMIKVIRTLET